MRIEESARANIALRTFACIEIPESQQVEIRRMQEALPRVGGALKLVLTHNLHVTLRFFGNLTNAQIGEVSTALEDTAKEFNPFALRIEGLGAFPNAQRPRVVWAGVTDGAETLGRLYRHLEGVLKTAGFEPERSPFRAHVTLARARPDATASSVQRLSSAIRLIRQDHSASAKVPVEHITLMNSQISCTGSLYTPVVRAVLEQAVIS